MQDGIQELSQPAAASKKTDRNRCIGIPFGLSVLATAVLTIAIGDYIHPEYAFGTSVFIGQITGRLLGSFLLSLLFFAIVRRLRKASVPTAGLGTGIVVMLFWSYSMYFGATHP